MSIEIASSGRHRRTGRGGWLRGAFSSILAALFITAQVLFSALPALAGELPTGATVAAGTASVSGGGAGLVVDQSSANAIINWSSFGIGAGNSVQFNNGAGATLNRVTGSSASSIDGLLSASGSVYLVNPNGVIVGENGVVSAGGSFVASTLDVDNADFMNGGDTTFAGSSTAPVINLGKVGALGGDVALIATTVENDGTISAPNGTAGLIAGSNVLMRDAALDDGKFVVKLGGPGTSATNKGRIEAAAAELRANGGNVYALAGNTGGLVRATGVSRSGGRVFLTAGKGGSVRIASKIVARKPAATAGSGSAPPPPKDGGTVVVSGNFISLASSAVIDVSGAVGGTALIGGDRKGGADSSATFASTSIPNAITTDVAAGAVIHASGTDGSGGNVVVWSDAATNFAGLITAEGGATAGNGGFAEVSSKGELAYMGSAELTAPAGKTGTLLLDPYNVTISSAATSAIALAAGTYTPTATSYLNTGDLQAALATANVLVTTGGASPGGDAGNITVANALSWSAATTLTLNAYAGIAINAAITAANGGLIVQAGTTAGATAAIDVASFTLGSGAWTQNSAALPAFSAADFRITGGSFLRVSGGNGTSGTPYLISDVYGLQGIGSSSAYLAANWKLAGDIDASGTANWNGGAGFVSIGTDGAGTILNSGNGFTGTLDGQSHSISDLTIYRPAANYVGLFGATTDVRLSNVALAGGIVTGYGNVGALVGVANANTTSLIDSVSSSAIVLGNGAVGGLVGANSAYPASSTARISNSSATGSVTGTSAVVGGLVGINSAGQSGALAEIIASYASGTVQAGTNFAGGLVGENLAFNFGTARVANSYATGSVSGASEVGGLVGVDWASSTHGAATIVSSYAAGSATAAGADVGGLVGLNWAQGNAASASISGSDALGAATGSTAVGGLLGGTIIASGGTISVSNAYATGLAAATSGTVGGLVGELAAGSALADSFWDIGTTGQAGAAGYSAGTITNTSGLTTAAAFTASSYSGWTIDTTPGTTTPPASGWLMINGQTRPFGAWEYSTNIANAHQLQLMNFDLDASYVLVADVDASRTDGTAHPSDMWTSAGFVPIGTDGAGAIVNSGSGFTGTFDGRGNAVSGLTIDRTANYVGLFGYARNATIENVGLAADDVASTLPYVGGLAGYAGSTTIANVSITGSVSGSSSVGGLIGSQSGGSATNVSVAGNVSGTGGAIGGLIGGSSAALVTDARASGTVGGGIYVGGLIGYQDHTSVISSSASAAVTGSGGSSTGGLVGYSNLGSIYDSYATGAVVGVTYVGGLVGYSVTGSISRSYATGDVAGTDYVGGLVGYTNYTTYSNAGGYSYSFTNISDAYSSGAVTGGNEVGGLVGYNTAQITDSYSLSSVTASGINAGGLIGHNRYLSLYLYTAYSYYYVSCGFNCSYPVYYSYGVYGNYYGTAYRTYATGVVSGNTNVGGLIGTNEPGSSFPAVQNSFWDTSTTHQTSGCYGDATCGGGATAIQSVDPTAATLPYAFNQSTYTAKGWNFTSGTGWYMVDGQTRPFGQWEHATTIVNSHQLQLIGMNSSTLAMDYTLGADIDLTDELADPAQMWKTASTNSADYGFVPIGRDTDPLTVPFDGPKFTGSFDGQGYQIEGLSIHRPDENYVGLFGAAGLAQFSDLQLVSGDILGENYVGGLVGYVNTSSSGDPVSFNGIASSVRVEALYGAVGGLAGLLFTSSGLQIQHSSVNADVLSDYNGSVGGLVGQAQVYGGTVVQDSLTAGSVSGLYNTGGLFGALSTDTMTIDQSHSTSSVTGMDSSGGLIGALSAGGAATIEYSYWKGSLQGRNSTGGLIGQSQNGGSSAAVLIVSSYASGTIAGASNVGGLIGEADSFEGSITIADSKANAAVSGYNGVGGLVGFLFVGYSGTAEISQSQSSGTVGGAASAAGGLIGRMYEYGQSTISRSYSTAAVNSTQYAGGLIGYIYNYGFSNLSVNAIVQSYATGPVAGTSQVGGLVGYAQADSNAATHIDESYAAGLVLASSFSGGGLVGDIAVSNGATVTVSASSYWDADTTGQASSAGSPSSNGLTTAELQAALPDTWDTAVWGIDAGVSYPYFQWRFPTGPSVISGTVSGVTGGSAGVSVTVADASDKIGSVYTGANGYYYLAVDPLGTAPILSFLDGGRFPSGLVSQKGNALAMTDAGGNATGLDIDAGWVNVYSDLNTLTAVQTNLMAAAKGGLGDAAIIYSVSGSTLTLNPGVNLRLADTAYGFFVNTSLSTSGRIVIEDDAGPITLNSGTQLATSLSDPIETQDAIVLAGTGFTNNAGSAALSTPGTNARWLVWSGSPLSDDRGGLAYDFKQYNATYGATTVVDFGPDDGFLYTTAPTVTVSLTGTVTKVYDGNTDASPDFDLGGAIDGDLVTVAYASAAYDDANVGSGKLVTVSGLSLSATNGSAAVYGYVLNSTSVVENSGEITRRSITVSADAGQGKTYGDADPTPFAYSLTSGTLVTGDSLTGLIGRLAGENVGNYNFTRSGLTVSDGNGGGNYDLTFDGSTNPFAIGQRSITVTADAGQGKTYGEDDPTPFAYSLTSGTLVTGDSLTGLIGRLTGENVGSYDFTQAGLTVSDGNGGGNYDLTFDGSTNPFAIGQATLTITADDRGKTYGDAVVFTGSEFTASGLKYGETVGSVSLTSAGAAATASVAGSPYTIVASAAAGGTFNPGNYIVGYNDGRLTVATAPLRVTADDVSKFVGQPDPALTYQITAGALFNGDLLTGMLVRDPGETSGTYAITQGTLVASDNYALTFIDGLFTISPAETQFAPQGADYSAINNYNTGSGGQGSGGAESGQCEENQANCPYPTNSGAVPFANFQASL